MLATTQNVTTIGKDLDHPECVCVGPDGDLYAGGEAGQLYHIRADGEQRLVASTGGFLLGIALDGNGRIHACDMKLKALMCIAPDGSVTERSSGAPRRAMVLPNYPVFDQYGNLYVSDSGDYYHERGTGCIFIIRPDGTTEVFHSGPFRFSNGLAIDPTERWLYVVQSTAANVVRIPLFRHNGPIEVTHQLPPQTVPDGIAFASDGQLVIACYKPDAVYLGDTKGGVEILIEDPTAELLNRPANVALRGGKLYISNLGAWHISAIDTELQPSSIFYPLLANHLENALK